MNRQAILQELKKVITPYVENKALIEGITEQTDLLADLKINSSNLVDIIIDAESKYNVEIDFDSAEKMVMVGSCIDVIEIKMKEKDEQLKMLSTGNDIVALDLINVERSFDKNFYDKILADSEQRLYQDTLKDLISFDIYLWMLWSIKESAYKYLKRLQPHIVFSPTKIIIQNINFPVENHVSSLNGIEWEGRASNEECITGNLKFADDTFYFYSKIHHEFIASVVSEDENFEDIIWGVDKIDQSNSENQSREVRVLLLNKLNSVFPGDDLRIEKNMDGCPVVRNGINDLILPVSLAHHGRFVSYTFNLLTS